MKTATKIPQEIVLNTSDPSMNFDEMRAEALLFIQKYCGNTWTDYNLHDPGVTILEAICFALTDLSYRTEFPISDILALSNGRIDYLDQSFHLPNEILNTHPVLDNDYRKVVLDEVEEVHNIWLAEPKSKVDLGHIRGIRDVKIALNPDIWKGVYNVENEDSTNQKKEEVIRKVKNVLLSKRMIGVDFNDFIVLQPKEIKIQAKVSILPNTSAEEILATIFWTISDFLNPHVEFLSHEYLNSGNESSKILPDGPILKNGAILDDALKNYSKKIDPKELIQIIGKIKGVKSIIELSVICDTTVSKDLPIEINESEFAMIQPLKHFSLISLVVEDVEAVIIPKYFTTFYKKIQLDHQKKSWKTFPGISEKISGNYRNLGSYRSIQNYFPSIYGLGIEGLGMNETDERRAAVKQLKAFLLIFEQIMANYLSQLQSVSTLFSSSIDDSFRRTYFAQPLLDVPGVNEIITYLSNVEQDINGRLNKVEYSKALYEYQQKINNSVESDMVYVERKNSFLDHLLSRFNLSLNSYSVDLFNHYYPSDFSNASRLILEWKSAFLKNIVLITTNRAKSFNYTLDLQGLHGEFNLFYFIYNLLYIENKPFQSLISSFSDDKNGDLSLSKIQEKKGVPEKNLILLDEVINIIDNVDITKPRDNISAGESSGDSDKIDLSFKHQDESLFKSACNSKNYKISPDVFNNSGFLLLFQGESSQDWQVIAKAKTSKECQNKIKTVTKYFIELSKKSEGLHFIENILLKPDSNDCVYGFEIFSKKYSTTILKLKNWYSFNDRLELFNFLYGIFTSEKTDYEKEKEFFEFFYIEKAALEIFEFNIEEIKKELFQDLIALFTIKSNSLDGNLIINQTVFIKEDLIVQERFFDYQLSVFIPSWPARFQENSFRSFINKILLEHIPAHLELKINYLNIPEMTKFENIYFSWLSSLQNNTIDDRKNHSISLLEILIKN